MKKMIWPAVCAATMVGAAAMAASPSVIPVSPAARIVAVPAGLTIAPPRAHRATGTALFNNLATLDPKGVYTVGSGTGFGLVTPDSPPVELAMAFTATTTTTVTEIDVGAGYISGTQNLVRLHFYEDAGGVPGTELWARATALPVDGTCCAVASVILNPHKVKVVAGKQYWVSLGIAKRSPDTFATWYGNVANQVDGGLSAMNQGSSWTAAPALPLAAFAVFGQ